MAKSSDPVLVQKQTDSERISRPRLARKVGLHHFAFFRGALEGLDLAELGERYLETGADRVRAKATQRWIRDELIAAARRQKPHVARLLAIPPARYAATVDANADPNTIVPSLETFQAERDPSGFYAEAELIALFEQEFAAQDPARARKSRRNALLRKKLATAIRWLESFVATEPVLSDPLAVWLDPMVTGRLTTAGLMTVHDLVARIHQRGKHWPRKVPQLGPIGAARLERWLRANHLLSGGELVTVTAATAPSLPASTAIVPLDRLRVPANLSGVNGTNRGEGNKLSASDDLAAIRVWLASLGPRANTVRSYQTQAERFLLWMLLERGKALSSATTEDCISYRDWLNALGNEDQLWYWNLAAEDWIGPRACPRFSAEWRPFTGPLSPSSQKLAVTVLTALCEWLTRQKYLASNPWDGVPPSHNLDGRMRTDHSLTPAQWQTTLAACADVEDVETRLRLRFILLCAYALGLRLSELTAMIMAAPEERAGTMNLGLKPGSDGEGWDLDVLGKRNKRRLVPVSDIVIDALTDYLKVREYGDDPGTWPAGLPLIATLPRQGRLSKNRQGCALSHSGLYRLLSSHFKRVAAQMDSRRDAAHLQAASTHWLRHTHATHSLAAGAPIEAVQENLGHASVATTAVYSHAGRKRRKAAVETLMAFAGKT